MSSPGTESHWWEYYFVRYFVGTVVGSAVIVLLSKSPGSLWYDSGLPAIKDIGDLNAKEITGLAALGFAFCYIASAPMLLLHATRAHLGLAPLRPRRVFWLLTTGAIAFLFLVVARCLSISWLSYRAVSLLILLGVVGFQAATIIAAHWDRFETISSFYWKLATARATDLPSVQEYVESYRHLREHGNAFSILILEFALAFVLYSSPKFSFAVVATLLWVFPSFYSWFIGSLLESRLTHARKQ